MSTGVAWHRGKEVTAEDLLRTEAHLLGRWEFQQPPLGRVDRFRLDGSVLFQAQADGSLRLGATDFRGLTDRGHLVEVGAGEVLDLRLPADYQMRTFELAAVCNPDWGEPRSDDPQPKVVLSVEDDAPPSFGGRLGLGRWRVNAEGELEMVELPRPDRLGALLPHDSWWEQWASPFRKALNEYLSLGRIAADADWKELLWIQELSILASEWVHMPLAELARRCGFVRWLAEGGDSGAGELLSPAGPDLPNVSGQELPHALVGLLGPPIRMATPAAPRPRQTDPLPTSLAVALRFLSPDTLLARFPAEPAADMYLCVALRCMPPARLQVRAGAGAQGFRVAAEMTGEPKATVMAYRLPSPPTPGETWRFSPLDATAAEAAYMSG